jgi:PAS domain S-box-containing protein
MLAILNHTPSIIVVKDLDGCYQLVNAECADVLGVSPEQIVGRHCEDVFPDISAQMRANDRQAIADGEPVYDETVLDRDGEFRTYLTATFGLPDGTGRLVETCTIGTDVTERKERESARRERLEWTERIESALEEERMLVYAQPVVETASGAREGYELLVRMRDRDNPDALLQPGSFLPAAEHYGLIKAIDVWMVRQALALAPAIAPRVNLSAVTLCDVAARDEILALLRAAPDVARGLVFEITETASAGHLDAAVQFAAQLVGVGCGLALDDFGTGFGSFTYLRQLPLRYLKIDRSFVTGLTQSADDRRVVQSIIGIAEQFSLRTIAEGVEDEPTLQLLDELGTHYAEGFHLGRPAPVPR